MGVLFFQQKKTDDAISAWSRAQTIKNDPLVLMYLGVAYLQKNDLSKAETYLLNSTKANDQNHLAHFNLGIVFQKQNKLAEAERSFVRCVGLSPEYFPAYYNLGIVERSLGRKTEAVRALKIYLKMIPPHLTTQIADARAILSELGVTE
ncbi:MAG: tetratricopeptide repeat protein [Spirochaetia bacterium]|nr:tetratricopeptide repeat protein [Spirochaetia bacterium]